MHSREPAARGEDAASSARAMTHPMHERRYEDLVADIDGIVWEADARTMEFTFVSQQAERLLGYPAEQWFAPGFWPNHIHPDDREWAVQFCTQACAAKQKHDFEYRMVAADGRTVWLRDIVSVIVEGGEVTRLRGVMVDITQLKQVEAERQGHLWFLEGMEQVNRAIHGNTELEPMVRAVLDVALTRFDCDRAWLSYLGDPEVESWRGTVERVRAALDRPDAALDPRSGIEDDSLRAALLSLDGALRFGPGEDGSLPPEMAARFGVRSMIAMALRPKPGQPFAFGLQQCSRPRAWAPHEIRLFEAIGGRLGEALESLSVLLRLKESERKLGEAQRIAHVGYWDRDLQTNRVGWSDEASRIFGLPAQQGKLDWARWLELVHAEDRPRVQNAMAEAVGGAQYLDIEYRVVHREGAERFVHSQGEVLRDALGRPLRIFGTVQDITERREAEDRLRASEARFRMLVDHATDAFFLHAERGRILDVNRQACESLGYSREELMGMTPFDFDLDIVQSFPEQLRTRLNAGEVVAFDTRHRRKDGTAIPVEVRIRPFWEGGVRYSLALARDMTERKRAEQALAESYNLLNAVVEGTSDAVFVKDLDGRYLMINAAGARFLDKAVHEVIGKNDLELFTPETGRAVMERDREVMRSEGMKTYEETVTAAGVTRTYLATKGRYRDAQGKVVGLIGISRDVTGLKRLEEQLRQSQKMEAVGRLAGGIAHDFNNLLTVINGYAEFVLNDVPADDPNRALLLEISRAGERAANLTRQLLAFSRKQVLHPQLVGLNTILREVCKLLRPVIGEDIELSFVPDPVLGLVKVDPGQFEQAIVNLAVNARDAMPQGGRLVIETHNTELDESYVARHPDVQPGRYVLVAVSDSGHGIDAATRTRIFEPFFTTKAPGKGTGLGLAMVYGFVRQSGGHIEVYSEVGHGTAFNVYLPRFDGALSPLKPKSEGLDIPRGSETVLLVEDEEAVRNLSKLVLEASGYTVLEARDGQEALEIAGRRLESIDLLITDLVMPRLGGRELARALLAGGARMRVILVSGYADAAALSKSELDELDSGVAFLQKPFTPTALARKVREVLDAERRGAPAHD